MSFLSSVKFRKAPSIAEVSVFESTTRKLLWESGGSVTCYTRAGHQNIGRVTCRPHPRGKKEVAVLTPIPARRRPVTELADEGKPAQSRTHSEGIEALLFIANYGKQLPILPDVKDPSAEESIRGEATSGIL
jgi:hypothetical protein